MVKAHTPINWENWPSRNSPINETNLNKMDSTIGVLDDRVIRLEESKLDKSTANTMVKDVYINETSGNLTVEKLNGSTKEIQISSTGETEEIKSLGLTVVDGMLCVTYSN